MKIEIKNRWNDSAIFAHEQEENTLAITVRMALTAHTDLSDANLLGANLRGANLRDADLTVICIEGSKISLPEASQ